jgi:hypothetical protein
MTLRQVIYRVVEQGGGDPTKSGITDSIALYARVNLADTVASATDSIGVRLKAAYADTAAGQSDTIGLYAKVNAVDTAPPQSDQLTSLALTGADTNAEPGDAITVLRLALEGDTNLVPGEAIKTGFAGPALSDSAPTPIDARPTITVHTWAASQTSSGSGVTNGANAVGAANGTVATVTGSGLLATNNTLTLTIPVASVPASGAKTLRCFIGYTASLNTASVTFTNPGGSPASGTVPVANGAVAGTPTAVALTTVGTSFTVTITMNAAALLAPTYLVDAVEIQTVSVI